MQRAEPYVGRFLSRFSLAVVPGIAASALAVFVLYAMHLSQMPEPAERLVNIAGSDDNLTAEERRELTRQMLKARRESPEIPVEVTPSVRPAAAATGTAEAPLGPEPRARGERIATAPPVPPAPLAPRPPRPRPEAAARTATAAPAAQPAAPGPGSASVALPPPGAAPGAPLNVMPPPAGAPGSAVRLPPVEVNTPPAEQAEPEQRGFAANVFSSLSVFAGTAANATGNGINWMIALPGKAISAGGKLISRDPATADSPPPADASPPKAKLL